MPATVDHRAGTAYRDVEYQVASTGSGTVVSAQGGIRYNGSAFQMLDAVGQYDPRQAAYNASIAAHALLYDMPHLLAGNGPCINGAYKTQTFVTGTSFLLAETWYTSTAMTIKLSTHSFTYTTGAYVNPATETWILYDGTQTANILHRIVDTMTYAGVNETSRTRTYS